MGVLDGWAAGVQDPEGFRAVGERGWRGDVDGLDGDEAARVRGAEGDAVPAGV